MKIADIKRGKTNWLTIDATLLVGFVKKSLHSLIHRPTQILIWATKRGAHA